MYTLPLCFRFMRVWDMYTLKEALIMVKRGIFIIFIIPEKP